MVASLGKFAFFNWPVLMLKAIKLCYIAGTGKVLLQLQEFLFLVR